MSLNAHCPGCTRLLTEADGEAMTNDRWTANDICIDGALWCLDCLCANQCACAPHDAPMPEDQRAELEAQSVARLKAAIAKMEEQE